METRQFSPELGAKRNQPGNEFQRLEVERRDILENPEYFEQLMTARGRTTVPVLRIDSPDGKERWIPESRDIMHYLKTISS